VLMPVPYVDASASIAYPEKWRRALVGAAGVLTELFVAALALLLWVAAEPGVVRTLAYNTALIGSVSTVLFNGNPLLRFDGYYVLWSRGNGHSAKRLWPGLRTPPGSSSPGTSAFAGCCRTSRCSRPHPLGPPRG